VIVCICTLKHLKQLIALFYKKINHWDSVFESKSYISFFIAPPPPQHHSTRYLTYHPSVNRYWLWALFEGHWQIVAQGTSIGNKKIDIFIRGPLKGVSGILFDNQGSADTPIISNIAAYYCDRY
jgi:hypothetical protein